MLMAVSVMLPEVLGGEGAYQLYHDGLWGLRLPKLPALPTALTVLTVWSKREEAVEILDEQALMKSSRMIFGYIDANQDGFLSLQVL